MKDYFKRKLKEGDLVFTMASGRRSRMRHGVVYDGGVFFGPYSTGGASCVLIDTEKISRT